MRTLAPLWCLVLLLSAAGCNCKQNVNTIPPSLGVTPAGVDFGQVKVNESAVRTVRLAARTQAQVTISSVTIEGAGRGAFTLGAAPAQVAPLAEEPLEITFHPTALEASVATLVIASDDPDRPTTRVALAGEGAKPILQVTPTCDAQLGCRGTVTVTPPAIDFGAEPKDRLVPIPETQLPTVVVVNAGPVALLVTKLAVEGADAAAFTFTGTLEPGGRVLQASEGFNVPIRFTPTSETQQSYAAELVIESDDADAMRLTVALAGTLRPNLPPEVCANLVRVVPPPSGDAPRDYSSASEWDSLRMPPAGGYDFSARRDVRPGDLTIFSASSPGEVNSSCSFDPEDGRTSLTYAWRLVSTPRGAEGLGLSGATTPQVQLRPVVTGEYVLELTVADVQGHATTVPIKFAVAVKEDLVAQLQWSGAADVDLDVHLVRPSAADGGAFAGVFDFFSHGAASKTSGDINGYAVTTQRAMPGAGFDFDWGQPGSSDDPRLNVDDTGSGALLENVSLNYPENDAPCATASCRYKVLVHYFKDARNHAPAACFVTGDAGCLDGDACGCATPQRCVADGAPIGDAGVGAGKCFPAPNPVVRLFFRGSPTPAAVIPLDTLVPPDELVLGAPCQMLYVADVEWPAKSAVGSLPDGGTPPPVVQVKGADVNGRITAPVVSRFGWRQTGGSLQCSPDVTLGGVQWYAEQPR
ncbi:MAG: choice-of-anchor D domain-containing protein [Myxococcota bacterium]